MAKKNDSGSHEWHGINSHWVTIIGVEQPNGNDDALLLRIADSITGKIVIAFLYSESREARVPLSFTVDEKDKENWNWVNSDRCLFLSIPSLPLGTLKASWHDRTYIAARYLIGHKVEQ